MSGGSATAILPPYVPFSIGGVAIAWGAPDSVRWGEAGGLAQAVPQPPPAPPTVSDQAAAMLGRAGEGVGQIFSTKRVAVFGGIGALAATGVWAKAFPSLRKANKLT